MPPEAELSATGPLPARSVLLSGGTAADSCGDRSRSAGAVTRPRRLQKGREEAAARRPRRSALSHWVFWPTLDQQLGASGSPRSTASSKRPGSGPRAGAAGGEDGSAAVPGLLEETLPSSALTVQCGAVDDATGEVRPGDPSAPDGGQSSGCSAEEAAAGPCEWCGLPRAPGHAEACALRPAQCRHCGQRLAAVVLPPHEEVCRRRRAAQKRPQRQVLGGERPLSVPGTPCEPAGAPAERSARLSPQQPAVELPQLPLKAWPPAALAPLKSTPRELPGACPAPPLAHDSRQQARPAAAALEAPPDATIGAEDVPSLEELRHQVRRERDAYIQSRLAAEAACH